MKTSSLFRLWLWLLALFLYGGILACAQAQTGSSPEFDPKLFTVEKEVLILGSHRSFHEAHQHAKAISRGSGVPFSMQGMSYHPKRGLILPDEAADPIYAGSYIGRRYHTASLNEGAPETEYLSIERSEAYSGFAKGYYIIVAGIFSPGDRAARASLAKFKPLVSDAYLKRTPIYYGCLH